MNNEEKEYIKLTPFKMQVLQSFPFIDADFDALTNYELLCKVVDYLNKTIDNVDVLHDEVEEYITKYNELKAYVDNYFDNLDVQEEINNKLDEMAESGELTNLIKDYVDPIYEAYEEEINQDINDFKSDVNDDITGQNTEISNFKTLINNQVQHIDEKVTNATSGSPKGVYATLQDLTNDDPDHDYIYVVLADGNWYYYDSTLGSWTSGGTYQSTGLPNSIKNGDDFYNFSIDPIKLDFYNFTENLLDKTKMISGWIYNNGVIQSSTASSTSDYIPVEPNDILKCGYYLNNTSVPQTSFTSWVTFDENYNVTGHYTNLNENLITVPANSKYVRVSIPNTVLNADVILYKNSDTLPKYVPYNITIKPNFIPQVTSKILIVDPNDSYNKNYKTINEAISNANDGDVIIILPGSYNEIISISNKNLTLIGTDREKVILYNNTGLYDNTPLYISGNITISNITVKMLGSATSERKGYALHLDRAGEGIISFNNCTFYNKVGAALGAGGQNNQYTYFYNCKFISDVNATGGQPDEGYGYYGAVFFHAPTSSGRENCGAEFKECEFYSTLDRVLTLSSIQDVSPMELTFINCLLYSSTHKKSNVVYYNATTYLTISDKSYGNSTNELN